MRAARVTRRGRPGVALGLVLSVLAGPLAGCGGVDESTPRLLIIGMDGLDPVLLKSLMDAGKLPNFSRLAAQGSCLPLGTSMPPQSPVAWSNFISGADPGTHEIYDFVHRKLNPSNPRTVVEPYLSTSDIVAGEPGWWTLGAAELPWVGDFRIPVVGQQTVSLRQGGAFWDGLVAAGVPTTLYRVPANYPPPVVRRGWFGRVQFQCLCGMGTPDLLGGYGVYTFLTSRTDLPEGPIKGGRVVRLNVQNHRAVATLSGPPNFLKRPERRSDGTEITPAEMTSLLRIVRDPQQDVVKVESGGRTALLRRGEWSPWLPVTFETGIWATSVLDSVGLPTALPAIVRIFAKEVHPEIELYVSPLQIDPRNAANAISAPPDFAAELAAACGPYYTQGIPEDQNTLRTRGRPVLTEDEFLAQVRVLVQERMRQWDYALQRFERGLLFFYFGHTDQLAHVFWRDRDPGHPGRVPEQGDKYASVIDDTYIEMDRVVGDALRVVRPQDTLIVMSDHGFASFRRGFNLNTWLAQQGYINIRPSISTEKAKTIDDFDWGRTRAYGLGINSLYINVKGRERRGIVDPGAERTELMREIAEKLKAVRDDDGTPVIDTVYLVDELYPQADRRIAPDMLIGYARNYRGGWATALGGLPAALLEDNLERWSGDHCIAQHLVPGVILCNRPLNVSDPNLTDLAPTILATFGLSAPGEMRGRVLYARTQE